jgi:hypothetical protein
MIKSAKGLPANRESELRDCLALIQAGQLELQMREGVTLAQCEAYWRQAEFLSDMAHKRYREGEPS